MSKKTCFVIMPFSKTKSTSEAGWTFIYEKIIKSAVEESNLGFECKRSTANRGNIVKDIINSLNESDVVIADMTDNNANVCYELGIRHSLKVGTILLAQKREFLKIFDLNNYASHVYSWKRERNREEVKKKIKQLLIEYLSEPEKPDNPVLDFLQRKPSFVTPSPSKLEGIVEYDNVGKPHIVIPSRQLSIKDAIGFILLANSKAGVSLNELVNQVSKSWKKVTSQQISSTIANQMQGLVMKEGEKGKYVYRLSGTGNKEIQNIIKLLKKD